MLIPLITNSKQKIMIFGIAALLLIYSFKTMQVCYAQPQIVSFLNDYQKELSKNKIDELIIPNIAKDTELKQILEEITTLERLPYNNTKISVWENKALKLIEAELGSNSDCYIQFLYQTQQGFWRPGSIDPRMIIVSPELYQQEYVDQLQRYSDILKQCMENK